MCEVVGLGKCFVVVRVNVRFFLSVCFYVFKILIRYVLGVGLIKEIRVFIVLSVLNV